jgi:hypothetical protein
VDGFRSVSICPDCCDPYSPAVGCACKQPAPAAAAAVAPPPRAARSGSPAMRQFGLYWFGLATIATILITFIVQL